MYGKVNPTGCTERYGLIQVRLDFFLEKGDARYDDPRFYQVDPTSKEYLLGYTGKLDKEGQPRDLEAYAAWEASLPRIWLPERCFHHHFIYVDPYALRDEHITDAMKLHLPNFYKAWTEEWDKVQGGMRHGWDVAARKRPVRYSKTQPELYEARKAEYLAKVDILKASDFATQATGIGETFPSTDIDVGDAATDRGSYATVYRFSHTTLVDGGNAANDTGSIDTVESWWSVALSGNSVKVGTFSASGDVLTCRDAQLIGEVASGSKETDSGLDIDITAGDFIGVDARADIEVRIERDTTGGTKTWYLAGQYCDPTDSATFSAEADDAISLYGTGETPCPTTFNDTLTDSVAMGDTIAWTHPVTLTDSVAVGDADWIDLVGEKLKVTVVPDDPFTVTVSRAQPYVAAIDPSDPYKVELASEDE